MSRKLSLLFWCGVFVAVFGLYFLLTNLLSAFPFASSLWHFFVPYASISQALVLVFSLAWYVFMVCLGVVLVVAGVNIARKSLIFEQTITSSTNVRSYASIMPRKRSKLFWYGLFMTIFSEFLIASNIFEIIRQYISYSFFPEHGLTVSQTYQASVALAINSAVFNLTLDCVLVVVGVYVLKQRYNGETSGQS